MKKIEPLTEEELAEVRLNNEENLLFDMGHCTARLLATIDALRAELAAERERQAIDPYYRDDL